MEYDTPVGNFFKISYSPLYKANGKYAPLCKNCVSKHFDEYSRRYRSDKKACILLCHELDIPFYHTLFDSIVQNNNNFTMGLYLRQMNNRQYQNQTFNQTLLNGELNKSARDLIDEQENKWTDQEKENRDEAIRIIGYDPFDGYSENDRRFLFNELIKYLDEDIIDDPYKISQIIQIVNNNNQIRQCDLAVSRMDPAVMAKDIDVLNATKAKLVTNNDKIAKENEISVKNRTNKEVGKGTLTYLMKDMRNKNLREIEQNYYDQLKSPATQWAADMSLKAIKENTFFDENDQKDVFEIQRELIQNLTSELDDLKEEHRLLLIENQKLKSGGNND